MLATILCLRARPRRPRQPALIGDTLHALVWRLSARFGGNAVERTSDRVMVVFDGPARAIRCARAISATAKEQGSTLSIGVHAGECDIAAGIATGVAAGISCRISSIAQAHEVLVSRTVVDLVAGSGLHFRDRGAYRLADGLGKWHVFDAADDERDSGEELVAAGDYHVVQP